MFFPKAMTEIELIVPAKDVLAVTKILSGHGVFHQSDSSYSYPGAEKETSSEESWQNKAAAFAGLERRVQTVMQALKVEESLPHAKDLESVSDAFALQSEVENIERTVRQTNDELSSEQKKLEQLQGYLSQLEPIDDVEADFSAFRDSRYVYSLLGTMPTDNVERLKTSLARVPHVFITLRSEPQKKVVWLAGSHANADILERAVRSSYLNPLSLPEDYQGTPSRILKLIRENIDSSKSKINRLKQEISRMADQHREKLQSLFWQIHSNRMISDAIVRYGRLRYTYVIVGWVVSNQLDSLARQLKLTSKEILIETFPVSRAGAHRNVPVALRDSKWVRPFQLLVTNYARPRYGEIDPTWLLALTFPLLFGAMFGDVGQGAILALLGLLVSSKKVKFLRGLASLGGLITLCGVMATIFGFLYGSFFGFEEILHPIWAPPLENIIQILAVTIGAGVVILSIGFLIGIFNLAVERNWSHLIFGHTGIAGLALYWSILGYVGSKVGVLSVPTYVFIAITILSALAVMFSELFINLLEGHRPLIEGSRALYFILQAPMELFEVGISLFSNTFSYARVAAFAIVHTGLSLAMFAIAELGPKNWIGILIYWFVVLLGNAGIILIEGLIVGIQTMRLSYYELFSKFFSGGGKPFEPLKLANHE